MSKKHKYDKYRKEKDKINRHHCINASSGGKNVEENTIEIMVQTHRALHEMFGNDLPHETLRKVIEKICKPFQETLKQELFDVLDRWKGTEYKENAYHGNKVKHGPNRGYL